MTQELLKLRATDAEDMQVISAVLQDAIAPICDMIYDDSGKNFIMVVHRMRREGTGTPCGERICCAVNVHGVDKVQLSGIDLAEQSRMLDLLATVVEGATATLMFAGGAKIRLQMKDWKMLVEDFGEAWPSHCNPCHDSDVA